jgi:glycosyltransferase involved in cell wall biosynthesis
LRAMARGTTTAMLGYVDDAELNALMGRARAAILPGEEDFGLLPLEAAAAGRPAIALRRGGALETIVDGVTGTFFDEPDPSSLAAVLRTFDANRFDSTVLRTHAQGFAPAAFSRRLREIVERVRAQTLGRA